MALRIAFCETIFCMSPCDDDKKEDCILLEEFKSNSLQSRPGFAEIRIGKSRSIISSFLDVLSLTLNRKHIWSSLDFAPPFAALRQLLKQVNQRLRILTICFFWRFNSCDIFIDFKIQARFLEELFRWFRQIYGFPVHQHCVEQNFRKISRKWSNLWDGVHCEMKCPLRWSVLGMKCHLGWSELGDEVAYEM